MTDAEEFIRLAASEEPYHPDLLPWLEELDVGPMLRHPLVYEYLPRPGLANRRYEQKKEALAEALEKGNWHTYVFLHERPYRAKALWDLMTELAPGKIDVPEYAELVAAVWTDSENIHQNLDVWEELFEGLNTEEARPHLMDAEELAVFEGLPEWITIYRGCIVDLNENGLSWTLDRDRAAWFARRFVSSHGGAPEVRVATVHKSYVLAYFAGRNEEEIVVVHDAEVSIERTEEP